MQNQPGPGPRKHDPAEARHDRQAAGVKEDAFKGGSPAKRSMVLGWLRNPGSRQRAGCFRSASRVSSRWVFWARRRVVRGDFVRAVRPGNAGDLQKVSGSYPRVTERVEFGYGRRSGAGDGAAGGGE